MVTTSLVRTAAFKHPRTANPRTPQRTRMSEMSIAMKSHKRQYCNGHAGEADLARPRSSTAVRVAPLAADLAVDVCLMRRQLCCLARLCTQRARSCVLLIFASQLQSRNTST